MALIAYLGFLGLRTTFRYKIQWRVSLRKQKPYSPKMKIRNEIILKNTLPMYYWWDQVASKVASIIYFPCSSQTLCPTMSYWLKKTKVWPSRYHSRSESKDDMIWTLVDVTLLQSQEKFNHNESWSVFRNKTPNTTLPLETMAVWNHSSLCHSKGEDIIVLYGRVIQLKKNKAL